MVNQTVGHPHCRIVLINKNEPIINICNRDQSPENYAVWRKPILKGYILFDSIYIILLKWQNYGNGLQIKWFPGVKAVGREWIWLQKGRIGDSDGDENVLYLVCISIISLIILFYSFARCCCWGKLGKRYMGFLNYVIQLHENL